MDGRASSLGYLRRWFRREPGPSSLPQKEGRVIALASGKGGTGKSFLATNLAVAMHNRGLRVAVADCDFGLGNAHLLLGVNPRLCLQHLLAGSAEIADVVQETPFGPSLLAGGSGVTSLAELEGHHLLMLGRFLGWLAERHDVLVLDSGPGLSPQAILTALAAEDVVLVTNPEIAALTDAYALIKCLARYPRPPRVQVAINRVHGPGQGWQTFQRLAEVARRFTGLPIHYAGEIPEDPAVTQRRLGQPPLVVSHPECAVSRSVVRLLRTLEERLGTLAQRATGEGVERRVLATLHQR